MILKCIGISLIILITAAILRTSTPNLVPFVVMGGVVALTVLCFDTIKEVIDYFSELCSHNSNTEGYKLMVKGVGIAFLSNIGAELCRECEQSRLASVIELAAKAELMVLSLPLIGQIIEVSRGFTA